MTLSLITKYLESRASSEEAFDAILKFKFPEGDLYIDGRNGENKISSTVDAEPDCTLSMKLATFEKLKDKKMNPMTAIMFGKIKLKGDATVALKLKSLI